MTYSPASNPGTDNTLTWGEDVDERSKVREGSPSVSDGDCTDGDC